MLIKMNRQKQNKKHFEINYNQRNHNKKWIWHQPDVLWCHTWGEVLFLSLIFTEVRNWNMICKDLSQKLKLSQKQHLTPVVRFQGVCVLLWRHNERDGVSNHQPHECLLNCKFRHRSKKTSELRVTGVCAGNSPVNSPYKGPVTRKMFPFVDVMGGADFVMNKLTSGTDLLDGSEGPFSLTFFWHYLNWMKILFYSSKFKYMTTKNVCMTPDMLSVSLMTSTAALQWHVLKSVMIWWQVIE